MDLELVTLTQLRYAVAISEAESFRQAATRCHVSQSGLSMQVQKLEELLGVVLFDRSKKPVLVTPEGEAVLEQMRAVLRGMERLGQVVAEEEEPRGATAWASSPPSPPPCSRSSSAISWRATHASVANQQPPSRSRVHHD